MNSQAGPIPTDHEQRLQAGRACLEAALQVYLPQGFSVTCCCDPDHVGVGKQHGKECKSPGKSPVHPWTKLQTQLPTAPQVEKQWGRYPIGNVGCVLGQASALVRVDVDGTPGEACLQAWSHGDLPATWEFRSSAAGRGLLYRWEKDQPCQTVTQSSPDGAHVELRLQGNGAQTVLPPSRHMSGSLYTWMPGHSPDDLPLAPAPAWLVERMRIRPRAERPRRETPPDAPTEEYAQEVLRYIPNPSADRELWLKVGMGLHSTQAAWAWDAWDAWSQQYPEKYDADNQGKAWESFSLDGPAGKDPITFGTLVYLARQHGYQGRNGSTSGTGSPERPLPLSDYTNALAFVCDHAADVRYCEAWKKWLHWTKTHWSYHTQGPVLQKAKQTIRRLLRETEHVPEAALPVWMAHIKRSLSTAALKAMVESAQNEPPLPLDHKHLNRHPWLLPCLNGTLDLKTGILRSHAREDLLTECLSVAYDAAATCQKWEAFLWQILGGTNRADDTEEMSSGELEERSRLDTQATILRDYLQRVLGSCLTGDVSEQDLYVFYGVGANGKSTLLGIIMALLGQYAMKAAPELLMASQDRDRHPTERADLFGKRFVAAIETQEGRRINEALVKELTGGDPIRARRMREDFWEFLPTHKIILATNHKPEIRGTDHAIWRRVKLIPFTVIIPDDKQDTQLPTTLLEELPGILAWLVRGCLDWQHGGLRTPAAVVDATAQYRKEEDMFEEFLEGECFRAPSATCASADLYAAYLTWCLANDKEPLNKTRFGKRLGDSGFTADKGAGGRRLWRGVGLPSAPEEDRRVRD
jgi:putative DNA primase/helicase